MNSYQFAVSNTIEELILFREKLTDHIFQIAINGDLKDWAEDIDIRECFYFSKELLLSLDDFRIQSLIALVEEIETFTIRFSKD